MNLNDILTIWKIIKKDKFMIWIARIICFFICILLVWSVVKNIVDDAHGKHIKVLYGLVEDNIPKEHPDTVRIPQKSIDTVYVPKIIYANSTATDNKNKSQRPSELTQENKNGNNQANVNNGTNNGIIGNNAKIIVPEKTFTPEFGAELVKHINNLKQQNNITSMCVHVILESGSNGAKVGGQILDYLNANRFNADLIYVVRMPLDDGFVCSVEGNCIAVYIGTI